MNSHGEAKQAFGESSSDSNEVEFSGGGGQDEPSTLEGTGGNLLLRVYLQRKEKVMAR